MFEKRCEREGNHNGVILTVNIIENYQRMAADIMTREGKVSTSWKATTPTGEGLFKELVRELLQVQLYDGNLEQCSKDLVDVKFNFDLKKKITPEGYIYWNVYKPKRLPDDFDIMAGEEPDTDEEDEEETTSHILSMQEKVARFAKAAPKRLEFVKDHLRKLGNCANKHSYQSTQSQRAHYMKKVQEYVDEFMARFKENH